MRRCIKEAFHVCLPEYLLDCLFSWNSWASITPPHTWTSAEMSEFRHRQRQGAPGFWRLFSFRRHNRHRNAPLRRRGQDVFCEGHRGKKKVACVAWTHTEIHTYKVNMHKWMHPHRTHSTSTNAYISNDIRCLSLQVNSLHSHTVQYTQHYTYSIPVTVHFINCVDVHSISNLTETAHCSAHATEILHILVSVHIWVCVLRQRCASLWVKYATAPSMGHN